MRGNNGNPPPRKLGTSLKREANPRNASLSREVAPKEPVGFSQYNHGHTGHGDSHPQALGRPQFFLIHEPSHEQ